MEANERPETGPLFDDSDDEIEEDAVEINQGYEHRLHMHISFTFSLNYRFVVSFSCCFFVSSLSLLSSLSTFISLD